MTHTAALLCRTLALAASLGALVACDSSQRFGGYGPTGGPIASTAPASPPPPLTAAPSLDDADTQTLPPPPGSGAIAGSAPLPPPAPGGLTAGLPPAPGTPTPGVATAPGNLPRVATAPVPSAPAAAAPTRTGVTGNWALTESAGNRCRITLSSAPKLDLYGAGTNGCKATELQRVNAWELSGSEVILYESGGAVVARLRQAGDGAFSGVSTRSGAPISMAK